MASYQHNLSHYFLTLSPFHLVQHPLSTPPLSHTPYPHTLFTPPLSHTPYPHTLFTTLLQPHPLSLSQQVDLAAFEEALQVTADRVLDFCNLPGDPPPPHTHTVALSPHPACHFVTLSPEGRTYFLTGRIPSHPRPYL